MEHARRYYVIIPESGTDIIMHHGEWSRIVQNIIEGGKKSKRKLVCTGS